MPLLAPGQAEFSVTVDVAVATRTASSPTLDFAAQTAFREEEAATLASRNRTETLPHA